MFSKPKCKITYEWGLSKSYKTISSRSEGHLRWFDSIEFLQISAHSLRPLQIELPDKTFFLISTTNHEALQNFEFRITQSPTECAVFLLFLDARYCLRAVHYHLRQLIKLYEEISLEFSKRASKMDLNGSQFCSYGDQYAVLFEFDAFLTQLRTTAYMLRDLPRRLFRYTNEPKPQKLEKAITQLENRKDKHSGSNELLVCLRKIEQWILDSKIKDYRDYLIHGEPLNNHGSAMMTKLEDQWATRFFIPENPEERKKSNFQPQFGNQVDIMTFSFEKASEFYNMIADLISIVNKLVIEHKQDMEQS